MKCDKNANKIMQELPCFKPQLNCLLCFPNIM